MKTADVHRPPRGLLSGRALRAVPLLLAAAFLSGPVAAAEPKKPDAQARYQKERALCLSGKSQQDRQTCLKEAAAALGESRRGGLSDPMVAFQREAMARCKTLPADEKKTCESEVPGLGSASGVVERGGIYVQTEPAPVPATAPAASQPGS